MSAGITLEEWGVLASCRDDGAAPTEARFPRRVYEGLVERGLMRKRTGKLPDGGLADFFLTTPEGEEALAARQVKA